MKAKPKAPEQDDLFRARLVEIIDMRHELVKLAALIDRDFFGRDWAGFFPSGAVEEQSLERVSVDTTVTEFKGTVAPVGPRKPHRTISPTESP